MTARSPVATRRWAWPDGARGRAYLRFMAWFYVVFFPVYIGAGYASAASGRASNIFFAWETDIPFWPWMIWPYLSLFPLFLLPLFQMSPQEMAALTRQSIAALVLAGLCFLALPGRLGFAPAPIASFHADVFALVNALDTPHNLAPSLHVVFAALILMGCAAGSPRATAAAYWLWLLVMSASTVLVHQHHVFDVVAGLALATAMRLVFPPPPITPPRAAA